MIISSGDRLITERISKAWTCSSPPRCKDCVQPRNIKLYLTAMPHVLIEEDADAGIGACFQAGRDVPDKKILLGNTAQFFK